MNPFSFAVDAVATAAPAGLANLVVPATAALALAAFATALAQRASAATRHSLWLLGLLGALFWPVLVGLVPGPRAALVPSALLARTPASPPDISSGLPTSGAVETARPAAPVISGDDDLAAARSAASPVSRTTTEAAGVPISNKSLVRWIPVVWLGGALVLLARSFGARLRLARLRRRALPWSGDEWGPLFAETAARFGVQRGVRLLRSPDGGVPMTFGAWRPVVVLPASAEDWSIDRRRAVLAHELAHVRRWDCLTQAVAEIAIALHWFNPLVWLAAHRIRVEREFACDDLVLGAGWRPSDYAGHLVDLVETLPPRAAAGLGALGVARGTRIAARVSAIVSATRERGRPGKIATCGLLAVLAVGGLACPRVAESTAQRSASEATASRDPAPPAGESRAHAERIENLRRALDLQRARVEQYEDQLHAVRERQHIAETPGGEPTATDAELRAASLQKLVSDVHSGLVRVVSMQERLGALDERQLRSVLLTIRPDEQMLQHLCLRQADAEVDLARVRSELGETHPEFRKAQTVVDLLEKNIASRIQGILSGMAAQRAAYEDELKVLEAEAKAAESAAVERGKAYREYFAVKRRLENERIAADVLARKLAQYELDAVIGPSAPGNPL